MWRQEDSLKIKKIIKESMRLDLNFQKGGNMCYKILKHEVCQKTQYSVCQLLSELPCMVAMLYLNFLAKSCFLVQ